MFEWLIEEQDLTRVRGANSRDERHEGCLAGAVRPEQSEEFALLERERHAIEREDGAVAFAHLAQGERRVGERRGFDHGWIVHLVRQNPIARNLHTAKTEKGFQGAVAERLPDIDYFVEVDEAEASSPPQKMSTCTAPNPVAFPSISAISGSAVF